jgi:tRNA threonylcarbamoyladenosine biosynthesis protein TsaE
MSDPLEPSAITIESACEQQTLDFAGNLATKLRSGDVLALEGPLGSGKTCFVRGLAKGLNLDPRSVSSPTFVICQEYSQSASHGPASMTLAHIDAYRLHDAAELETIGWRDLLQAPDTIIAVEWPSKIGPAMTDIENRIDITFEHVGRDVRMLRLEIPQHMHARILPLAIPPLLSSMAACRTCDKAIPMNLVTAPFCSERCRLADLGKWFNESYRTSRAAESDEDFDE